MIRLPPLFPGSKDTFPAQSELFGLFLRVFMFFRRIKFRWRERRRLRELAKTFLSIKRLYDQSEELGLENVKKVHNVGLYILILDRDLTTLSWDMMHANDSWRMNFISRQMAVFLYEAAEDLPQMLGHEYREVLRSLGVNDEMFQQLNQISKTLSSYRSKNEKFLKKIRVFVGAHRDHRAGEQLRILESIKPLELYALVGDFYEPLNELVRFQTRLTILVGDRKVLLGQFLNKARI